MTQFTVGSVIDENGNACLVQTAFANVAASTTDQVLVAAVAGRRVRVLGYVVQTGGTPSTLVFNSKGAGAGTAISSTQQPGANGGRALQAPLGGYWFQTNVGEGLSATSGAGSTTGVDLVYVVV